jgi:hypothetical protein
MNNLQKELKLTNQEAFEELLKQGVKNAFDFINQNYISKEEMLDKLLIKSPIGAFENSFNNRVKSLLNKKLLLI